VYYTFYAFERFLVKEIKEKFSGNLPNFTLLKVGYGNK